MGGMILGQFSDEQVQERRKVSDTESEGWAEKQLGRFDYYFKASFDSFVYSQDLPDLEPGHVFVFPMVHWWQED
eukprot:853828-Lingulodinium_polyedra.AAC.1